MKKLLLTIISLSSISLLGIGNEASWQGGGLIPIVKSGMPDIANYQVGGYGVCYNLSTKKGQVVKGAGANGADVILKQDIIPYDQFKQAASLTLSSTTTNPYGEAVVTMTKSERAARVSQELQGQCEGNGGRWSSAVPK